jgi:thiamine pyrophosphate-dependent acetolactate synthase large subunit-like protein
VDLKMAKAPSGSKNPVSRRGFLTGAATGAAALAAGIPSAAAQQSSEPLSGSVTPPTSAQMAREAGNVQPPTVERAARAPGSDLMVDVLRDLGVEYVSSNPGSSFEGLQESIINYGDPPNRMPEFITALHEMSAVDMASGYGRAEGKPMVALLHGTLGIQNSSMAIFQAFSGRIPVVLLVGRDDGFIQAHTADDMAAMVRGFTKWDAQPRTLDESLTAIQQAYNLALTPPRGPTLVVLDTELQKEEAPGHKAPAAPPLIVRGIDPSQAREIAKRLLDADNPRIQVGQLRTPEGVRLAVELAELVGACTSTTATIGSMSFPQRHPLCGAGAKTDYDFTLGLEAEGAQVAISGPRLPALADRDRNSAKIGFGNLRVGRPPRPGQPAGPTRGEMDIAADAEASLPHIIEEARRLMTNERRRTIERRSASHAKTNQTARIADLKAALDSKRGGWDASPVSTARLYADLWPLIKDEDWCLSSPTNFSSGHHIQLWDHNKPYSFLGGQPAGGMGYGLGQSVGAALAAKERGRIVINIQCDGDLNYAPGALWTAAHHKLPLLTIMHNNRAWHQEYMFVQYMTGVRGRGTDRGHIGTTLREPYINYAKMAEGYGMASEGPISDPTQLAGAYRRGINSVKRGEPYLIDVITQPR